MIRPDPVQKTQKAAPEKYIWKRLLILPTDSIHEQRSGEHPVCLLEQVAHRQTVWAGGVELVHFQFGHHPGFRWQGLIQGTSVLSLAISFVISHKAKHFRNLHTL